MVLSELVAGESGIIKELKNEQRLVIRLNAIGLTENAKVTLIRTAPFGDPIEIKVRDFYLAIRKEQADKIILEKV
ncbi:MAG: FeoA domain-containing protein [Clostridia bacterium]|nr:FeoA domain-containing protein [Clostridia bacterium]